MSIDERYPPGTYARKMYDLEPPMLDSNNAWERGYWHGQVHAAEIGREADAELADLREKALRWYRADGTFEVCASEAEVIERRKAAAVTLANADAMLEKLRVMERERDAYRKAKQENDERFMTERDEARCRVQALEGELAETQLDNELKSRALLRIWDEDCEHLDDDLAAVRMIACKASTPNKGPALLARIDAARETLNQLAYLTRYDPVGYPADVCHELMREMRRKAEAAYIALTEPPHAK